MQATPSISGRELSVGASDVQQYLDGSFPRTQDALGGLIALTMSHPQLSLPAGERLNLGMDVALATMRRQPGPTGHGELSSCATTRRPRAFTCSSRAWMTSPRPTRAAASTRAPVACSMRG